MVASRSAVGQVIAFAEVVRMRRQREDRRVHARCLAIIAASVTASRLELAGAPVAEWEVRVRRLRKLEELEAYVGAGGGA